MSSEKLVAALNMVQGVEDTNAEKSVAKELGPCIKCAPPKIDLLQRCPALYVSTAPGPVARPIPHGLYKHPQRTLAV